MGLTYGGRGLRSQIHERLYCIYAFPFLVRGGTCSNSDELHRIERSIRIVIFHYGGGSFGVDVDEAGDDGVVRVSLEAIWLSPGHIAFPHSSLLVEPFVPLRPSAAYLPANARISCEIWVLLNCIIATISSN